MAYATSTYLAIMAAAAAVAAAGSTVYSGYQQHKVSEQNAELQADAAQETLKANASDAWKQLRMDEAEMAANRVYFNTSGMTINEGDSSWLMLSDQAGNRGMNVEAIKQRGRAQAEYLMGQSDMSMNQGKYAMQGSLVRGGTTLLNTATSIYGSSITPKDNVTIAQTAG